MTLIRCADDISHRLMCIAQDIREGVIGHEDAIESIDSAAELIRVDLRQLQTYHEAAIASGREIMRMEEF